MHKVVIPPTSWLDVPILCTAAECRRDCKLKLSPSAGAPIDVVDEFNILNCTIESNDAALPNLNQEILRLLFPFRPRRDGANKAKARINKTNETPILNMSDQNRASSCLQYTKNGNVVSMAVLHFSTIVDNSSVTSVYSDTAAVSTNCSTASISSSSS